MSSVSAVHFAYNTGAHGNTPKRATNCHSTSLDSTAIAWMVISGTNNSVATIQGTAALTIGGTTTTNPFRVIATEGALCSPATADQFELEVYVPGRQPQHVPAAVLLQ